MEVLFVVTVLNGLFANSECNTGSDLPIANQDIQRELTDLKDTVSTLQREINHEQSSRLEVDRELSALTRRYRTLLLEFDDVKREQEESKSDLVKNISSVSVELNRNLDKISNEQLNSQNKTDEILTMIKADMKKEETKTQSQMHNLSVATTSNKHKLKTLYSAHADSDNRTNTTLLKMESALSAINQTLLASLVTGTLHRGRQAKELGILKLKTENVKTEMSDALMTLNKTMVNMSSEMVKLQNGHQTNELQKLKLETVSSVNELKEDIAFLNKTFTNISADALNLRQTVDYYHKYKGEWIATFSKVK